MNLPSKPQQVSLYDLNVADLTGYLWRIDLFFII